MVELVSCLWLCGPPRPPYTACTAVLGYSLSLVSSFALRPGPASVVHTSHSQTAGFWESKEQMGRGWPQ